MLPSFRSHVWPRIPRKLGNSYYAMATAHAALGTVVECAGLYLLLAAGTTVMPEKLRIMRYKLWMRIVLTALWFAILLGATMYALWDIPSLFQRSIPAQATI